MDICFKYHKVIICGTGMASYLLIPTIPIIYLFNFHNFNFIYSHFIFFLIFEQKKKGSFQHSSFLSGAATTAAGRLVAKEGVLEVILIKACKYYKISHVH
jgi:hypothetical protein